jgi:hypothetical protein
MFCVKSATAQEVQDSQYKKTFFRIGGNYLSNAVYSGRKDSARVSYVRPSFGYFHSSGFFVNLEMSVLTNSTSAGRIDEVALEGGYNFEAKKLDGGVYASKYFFSDGSYAVASEMQGSIGGYLSYETGFVKLGGGTDFLFSTGTDITVNANISHPFEMNGQGGKFSVSPMIQVIAGTQSFYRAYYQNRKFSFTTGNSRSKGHHSNYSASSNLKTLSFSSQNQFGILDYEISLPIEFETQRLKIYALPVLAVPLNPATYSLDGVLQRESLSNSFFTEVGVYYKF